MLPAHGGSPFAGRISSDTLFYADARLDAGATLPLDAAHEERAAYVVDGRSRWRRSHGPERLLVLQPGNRLAMRVGRSDAHVLMVGGAAMDGPRYIGGISSPRAGNASSRQGRLEGPPVRHVPATHGVHSAAGLMC